MCTHGFLWQGGGRGPNAGAGGRGSCPGRLQQTWRGAAGSYACLDFLQAHARCLPAVRCALGLQPCPAFTPTPPAAAHPPQHPGSAPLACLATPTPPAALHLQEPLDTSLPGYQPPLPESEVRPLQDEEHLAGEADGEGEEGGGYRRGRGGRGR